jgi:hypothetical protein
MVVRVRRCCRPRFGDAAPDRHLGCAPAGRCEAAHVVSHQLELRNICRPHYAHDVLLTKLLTADHSNQASNRPAVA